MAIDVNKTITLGNEVFKRKLEGDGLGNNGEKIRIKDKAVNHQTFVETAEVVNQPRRAK